MSESIAIFFSPDYDEDEFPGGERHRDAGFSRRHVVRFVCDHCHKGRSSVAVMRRHVERCFQNPATQSCKTCALFQPSEEGDYETGYPGCRAECGAGRDLSERLQTQCSDWEAVW